MKKGTATTNHRKSFGTFLGESEVTTESTIVATVEIRKTFQRAMQENVAEDHMAAIMRETSTAKWKLELLHKEDSSEWFTVHGLYPTSVSVFFTLTGPNGTNADIEKNDRLVALQSAGMGTKNQRRNWTVYAVNGEKWEPMSAKARFELASARADGKSMVSYADVFMPDEEMIGLAFEEVYGCGPQLRMVMSKVREAIQNEFKIRSHGLLIGKPGAAKSFTLQKLALLLPKDAVMWIDGTAMTSAGITDALKDVETMPRFIFVEEIDKADTGATSVLLGIMDKHGEIRKTTYRDKIEKECRCVVFATANSLERMQKIADGALLSRFGGNPITYERGQEEVLRRILNRELNDINRAVCSKPIEVTGKDKKVTKNPCGSCKECKRRNKWIEEVIGFCKSNKSTLAADTLDPRFVIDLCIGLSGDKEGTYLEDVLATSIKRETVTDFD